MLYARPKAQYVHHVGREAELCKKELLQFFFNLFKFILTQSINKQVKPTLYTIT